MNNNDINATMPPQQAISILSEIAAKYMGTRADHAMLDKAIASISQLISEKNAKNSP
jgi:hypothetical protein